MQQNDDILSFLSNPKQQNSENDLDFWLSANLNGESNDLSALHKAVSIDISQPEDDKKKKNTIASARFRAKKKQKDMELKNENEELQKKVVVLEGKLKESEMEIKWLKDLLVEKNKASQQQELQAQLALLLPQRFQEHN
jgi:FAD synthase